MATIFYSLAGEGRGHAVRAKTLLDRLKNEHRLVVFTFGGALDFLSPVYADCPSVDIERITGLRIHYSGSRLNLTKTTAAGLNYYFRKLPQLVKRLVLQIEAVKPDVVINDFELSLPRAARLCDVPVLSIDHQHFLLAYDLSDLPLKLREYAWMMRPVIKSFGCRAETTLVSSFIAPPLRRGYEQVIPIGPLIRKNVRSIPATDGKHLVAYLRQNTLPNVLEVLQKTGEEVRIYGLGRLPNYWSLRFSEIDPERFVEDLASSKAVITAAGSQILGESLYLGKPVFALPERNHHEQLINAHYLNTLGGGEWVDSHRLTAAMIRNFLCRLDDFRRYRLHPWWRADGTEAAVSTVIRLCSPEELHDGVTSPKEDPVQLSAF